jgi:NADPH:quinone reductase-like Zn-dependent oxidoreductase
MLGSAAVQIARHLGARVIGAAGSGKHDAVIKLGAEQAVDYTRPDWVSRISEITRGRGADVIVDLVGRDIYRDALRVLAPMGRIVIAGFSGVRSQGFRLISKLRALRKIPKINLTDMLLRSYAVMSFHIGRLLVEQDVLVPVWPRLVKFVEEKGIRPYMGQVYSFEDIALAHRGLESRKSIGKQVVRIF